MGSEMCIRDSGDSNCQDLRYGGFLVHNGQRQGIKDSIVDDECDTANDGEADEFAMLNEECTPLLWHVLEEGLFKFHRSQLTFFPY